jgi:hypothetical protein
LFPPSLFALRPQPPSASHLRRRRHRALTKRALRNEPGLSKA